jgi:hypothetical protein
VPPVLAIGDGLRVAIRREPIQHLDEHLGTAHR